jgi:hypothetical protein
MLAVINMVCFVLMEDSTAGLLRDVYIGLNISFLVLMTLECIVQFLGVGYATYVEEHWLAWLLIVVSIIAELVSPPIKVLQSIRALRILKIVLASEELKNLFKCFSYGFPVFFDIFFLGGIITYFYAVLGMEIFSSASTGKPSSFKNLESFETFGNALLALFQIATTNNWNEILYPGVDDTSLWMSIYFMSYYILICMILLNVLTSTIISLYELRFRNRNEGKMMFSIDACGEPNQTWRVKVRRYYIRDLANELLPPFNDAELASLKEGMDSMEKDVVSRLTGDN